MSTITVSTTAELKAALTTAQGGDTILLATGTYSAVSLQNFNFSTAVTITSADASHPAVLTDLLVKSSSGMNFTNLELDASKATADWPFYVSSSANLAFSHLLVHGSLDSNPLNDVSGLIIRTSTNVTVSQSEFEQLKTAVAFLDDDHLQILGNSFHDLSGDGAHGGGTSYATISGNSFTNFYNIDTIHPDAIQFWTTNTTTAAHDLVITDNVIVRGDGVQMQGIFITDQVGTLAYQNVTISDNMLVGTRYQGITVNHGENVAIANNIVAGLPDMLSWIRLESVEGATLTNNIAGRLTQVNDLNISVSNFTTVLPTLTEATQMLTQWLSTHSTVASVADGESIGIVTTTPDSTTTTSNTGTDSTSSGTTTSGTDTGSTSGTTSGTTTSGTDTGSTTGTTSGTDSGSTTKTGPVKQPYNTHGKKAGLISAAGLTTNTELSTDTSHTKISLTNIKHDLSLESEWTGSGHHSALALDLVSLKTKSHDGFASVLDGHPAPLNAAVGSAAGLNALTHLPVQSDDHWLGALHHMPEHPLF